MDVIKNIFKWIFILIVNPFSLIYYFVNWLSKKDQKSKQTSIILALVFGAFIISEKASWLSFFLILGAIGYGAYRKFNPLIVQENKPHIQVDEDSKPKNFYKNKIFIWTLIILFWPISIPCLLFKSAFIQLKNQSKGKKILKLPKEKCFNTNVVGVSYNNDDGSSRQMAISFSSVGDLLKLKHVPTAEHPNAIEVRTMRGKQIGYISNSDASRLNKLYGRKEYFAAIEYIGGGTDKKPTYGCGILIDLS